MSPMASPAVRPAIPSVVLPHPTIAIPSIEPADEPDQPVDEPDQLVEESDQSTDEPDHLPPSSEASTLLDHSLEMRYYENRFRFPQLRGPKSFMLEAILDEDVLAYIEQIPYVQPHITNDTAYYGLQIGRYSDGLELILEEMIATLRPPPDVVLDANPVLSHMQYLLICHSCRPFERSEWPPPYLMLPAVSLLTGRCMSLMKHVVRFVKNQKDDGSNLEASNVIPEPPTPDEFRLQRQHYRRLIQDGGYPWISKERLHCAIRDPIKYRNNLHFWNGWSDQKTKPWQVYSGQLARWRCFRCWQRKMRYDINTFSIYRDLLQSNLTRHLLSDVSWLTLSLDPSEQDQVTTWYEYLAFELRFLDRNIWWKEAWQEFNASEGIDISWKSVSPKLRMRTMTSDIQKESILDRVSQVQAPEPTLQDDSAKMDPANKDIVDMQDMTPEEVEDQDKENLGMEQRRIERATRFFHHSPEFAYARHEAEHQMQLVSWIVEQIPKVRSESRHRAKNPAILDPESGSVCSLTNPLSSWSLASDDEPEFTSTQRRVCTLIIEDNEHGPLPSLSTHKLTEETLAAHLVSPQGAIPSRRRKKRLILDWRRDVKGSKVLPHTLWVVENYDNFADNFAALFALFMYQKEPEVDILALNIPALNENNPSAPPQSNDDHLPAPKESNDDLQPAHLNIAPTVPDDEKTEILHLPHWCQYACIWDGYWTWDYYYDGAGMSCRWPRDIASQQ